MQPHIASDDTIDLDQRANIKRRLNGHMLQLGRILMIGSEHNHWERFKLALTNENGHILTLFRFLKDHKTHTPGQPRKRQPVARASQANNAQLCHMITVIIPGLISCQDAGLLTSLVAWPMRA